MSLAHCSDVKQHLTCALCVAVASRYPRGITILTNLPEVLPYWASAGPGLIGGEKLSLQRL